MLQVLVGNLGAPVGATLLGQIAGSVTLKTWPEQEVVATAVSKIVDATGRSDEDEFAHIYVATASPLSERWYALSIDALPAGAAWSPDSNAFALASGGRATRFRVGSQPMVAGVRVYGQGQGKQVVYVAFSERVPRDSKVVGIAQVDGKTASCVREASVVPASAMPVPGVDGTGLKLPANGVADSGVGGIRLTCTGGVDLSQTLRLDVQLAAKTDSAVASVGQALQVAMGPASWIDLADGGKLYKPVLQP
jgi:hypothetical protein